MCVCVHIHAHRQEAYLCSLLCVHWCTGFEEPWYFKSSVYILVVSCVCVQCVWYVCECGVCVGYMDVVCVHCVCSMYMFVLCFARVVFN